MHNLTLLEGYYKKFVNDINQWLPEDIIDVDIKLLEEMGLLHFDDPEYDDPSLTRYFHVIESSDKITLLNDEYVVWIVPENNDQITMTYTLIALNNEKEPQLELCYVTSGVYNTSRLVLRLLEKYLAEIEENAQILKGLEEIP